MSRLLRQSTLALMVILSPAVAVSATLISIDNPEADEVAVVGFELKKAGDVSIEAVGLQLENRDELNVYGWIIDHETRKPVWDMTETRTERVKGSDVLRKAREKRRLEKGRYELYIYAGTYRFANIKIRGTRDFFDFLSDIFSDRRHDIIDYLDDCYVKLSSDEISKNDIEIFAVTGDFSEALLRYNKLGDSEFINKGLELDQAMGLRIYSLIELPGNDRTPVDYGWILNADTREKVWEPDRWNTDWAGGDRKNRMYDAEITLPRGKYLLYFVTDDSHSYGGGFNANPPYDPLNWGITILPGKDFDKDKFHVIEPPGKGQALVDLTKARDDDFLQQAFRITRPTTIRVYAIGEVDYSEREFADRGWIQNAATGKVIWEMTAGNTVHAGGARKNRMFDGNIDLAKGQYIAYYITDDSHAYRSWNDSPPFDIEAWGLAIYPGPGYKDGDLEKLSAADVTKGTDILVKMVMVSDNQRLREKFTLSKQTRIRIYAIGEGNSSEMNDYGWIVDDRTGRSVWEMTWRNTEPAGGARKNRLFNDDLILDPGTYEVYYVTDGSHSFEDWNSPRPNDPYSWGITISVVKE